MPLGHLYFGVYMDCMLRVSEAARLRVLLRMSTIMAEIEHKLEVYSESGAQYEACQALTRSSNRKSWLLGIQNTGPNQHPQPAHNL